MSTGDIDIRFLQRGEEEVLLAFIKEMFPKLPGKHRHAHWDWQYAQNPNVETSGYMTLVAWDDNRIVGQRPLMPFRLCVDGDAADAVWAPDFMVHPKFRGKGVGAALIQRALDLDKVYVAITSSAAPLHIYEKAGAMRLPDVARFDCVHRIDDSVDRRVPVPVVSDLVAILGNAFLAAWHKQRTRKAVSGVRVDQINDFDEEFAELWKHSDVTQHIVAERSHSFLTWRFGKAPDERYTILAAKQSDRLAGYAVFRESAPGRFLITDIWSALLDSDILHALICACTERIIKRSGSQMTTCYASNQRVKEALLACGFRPRGRNLSLVVHPGKSGIDRNKLVQAEHWYVTAADSDADSLLRRGH